MERLYPPPRPGESAMAVSRVTEKRTVAAGLTGGRGDTRWFDRDDSRGAPRSYVFKRSRRSAMGKIVITEFISLDGVVEDPGGSEDFKYGGWSFEFDRGPEGSDYKLDETRASEALLLGRVTYEGFAEAWPSRKGDFADKFNNMPKYVVSSTLDDPDWNNTTVLEGDVATEVSKIRDQLDGEIVVHGSVQLAQSLLEHDLVDEVRLMVFPVVLGSGKRLFGDTADKKPLRLVDSKIVGDGVAILTYQPARVA
jgi:dihydrofolate reductase